MLSRTFLPPLALQMTFLVVAGILEARHAWFMPADHVPLRDDGWEVIPFLIVGLVGFIIFVPLHWLLMWGGHVLKVPPGVLYLGVTLLIGLCALFPGDVGLVLAILFAPCVGFMGLADWTIRSWLRSREIVEQRATDAFVQSRKQKLQKTNPS